MEGTGGGSCFADCSKCPQCTAAPPCLLDLPDQHGFTPAPGDLPDKTSKLYLPKTVPANPELPADIADDVGPSIAKLKKRVLWKRVQAGLTLPNGSWWKFLLGNKKGGYDQWPKVEGHAFFYTGTDGGSS